MTEQVGSLLLVVGLNAVAVLIALQRRSLSRGGAVAGLLVGAAILYTGGFLIWGMLMLFFVSSSVMSRVGRTAKRSLAAMHEKGGERDAVQVLANGGAGLVGSILFAVTGEPVFAIAAAGGIAAANADTWASELGVLSPVPPRSVVARLELPAGASGGVTKTGTLASIGGSTLVGIWFAVWSWSGQAAGPAEVRPTGGAGIAGPALLLLIVAGAGAVGSLVDSVLGATVQALYQTDDGSLTERRTNGTSNNKLIRGTSAVTNDGVNLISTIAGALLAGIAAVIARALGFAVG